MKIGEKIHIAQADSIDEDDVKHYKEPIELTIKLNDLTIMETTNNNSLLHYDNSNKRKWTGMANLKRYSNVFHVGDKLYLNGAKPTGEEVFGDNANAQITSVINPNLKLYFKIESLGNDENE